MIIYYCQIPQITAQQSRAQRMAAAAGRATRAAAPPPEESSPTFKASDILGLFLKIFFLFF